jgi:hypothetical protein
MARETRGQFPDEQRLDQAAGRTNQFLSGWNRRAIPHVSIAGAPRESAPDSPIKPHSRIARMQRLLIAGERLPIAIRRTLPMIASEIG